MKIRDPSSLEELDVWIKQLSNTCWTEKKITTITKQVLPLLPLLVQSRATTNQWEFSNQGRSHSFSPSLSSQTHIHSLDWPGSKSDLLPPSSHMIYFYKACWTVPIQFGLPAFHFQPKVCLIIWMFCLLHYRTFILSTHLTSFRIDWSHCQSKKWSANNLVWSVIFSWTRCNINFLL